MRLPTEAESSRDEIFIAIDRVAGFVSQTCVLETRPAVGRNSGRLCSQLPPQIVGIGGVGWLRYNDYMHFCSYKLKLEPTLRYPLPLTPELVAERLASDALAHGFASHP